GYDENGNGVLQEEKNPEGEVVQRVERTYDDDGNVTESDVFIHLRERGYSRKYRLVYTYTFWPESGE
ncbi:MAG: hypothetical protein JW861_08270, partial [Bacteroidales bacterium]|nr:hypothetical protein [Bacteroidales bacterium]